MQIIYMCVSGSSGPEKLHEKISGVVVLHMQQRCELCMAAFIILDVDCVYFQPSVSDFLTVFLPPPSGLEESCRSPQRVLRADEAAVVFPALRVSVSPRRTVITRILSPVFLSAALQSPRNK